MLGPRSEAYRTMDPMITADRMRTALERLDRAIVRLEGALEARDGRLAAERDDLSRDLERARAGEAAAIGKATAVSARLDAAIDRLQTVLEE